MTVLRIRLIDDFEAYMEEFYNASQPRDKDGKWARVPGGKAFSRMSAHPDNRRKPIASISGDGSEEDEFEAKEMGYGSVRGWIKAAYIGELGDGYQSVVTEFEHNIANRPPLDEMDRNGFMVKGHILDPKGKVAGEFTRWIMNDNGSLVATHELLDISERHQGKGLADRFNARAITVYQELGVDRVVLDAALDLGGYAWARQGFRIHTGDNMDPEDADMDRQYIIRGLASGERMEYGGGIKHARTAPSKQDKAELAALVKASDAGEDVQPIDIARIGEERARAEGKDTWFGKDLLVGSSWPGVYFFSRDTPVTPMSVELAYADARPKWRIT